MEKTEQKEVRMRILFFLFHIFFDLNELNRGFNN
jgi:hypothetical protein